MLDQGDGAAHGHGAAGRGATGVEVAESSGVAIMMNGGPGTVHARPFAAFEQFATSGSPAVLEVTGSASGHRAVDCLVLPSPAELR